MFNISQFVLCKVTEDGVKLPVDAAGDKINPLLPQNWLTYAEASGLAEDLGLRVGFVFTDEDPYFFLDIDDGYDFTLNMWKPHVTALCAVFPDAYMETSQSGRGIHIVAQCDKKAVAGHSCKFKDPAKGIYLELYTGKRFMMLGSQGQGDPNTFHGGALVGVVDKYFKPSAKEVVEWTFEPRGGSPIEDDAALIQAACARASATTAFGGSISFKQLWEADTHALAVHFPHPSKPWDESSADMSLAQRLAYWTGSNCERMKRLMLASGLRRDKWEREDYLQRTILNAAAQQSTFFTAKPKPGEVDAARLAGGFITADQIPVIFSGSVYVVEPHGAVVPYYGHVKPEQFNAIYGGYTFMLDDRKTTRKAWDAFTGCPTWRPPVAAGLCFRPDREPYGVIEYEGTTYANTWQGHVVEHEAGDVSRWHTLLGCLFDNDLDREIMESYLAAIVQNVGVKFQWCILLQGPQGNGKTFITKVAERAIGRRYFHSVNAQELGSKFNAWVPSKLLAVIEEVKTSHRREVVEALKPLITNTTIAVEGKGVNQTIGDNFVNFIMTSNHIDALPMDDSQRRFCPLVTRWDSIKENHPTALHALNQAFHKDLWDWAFARGEYAGRTEGLLHIIHYLKNYPIRDELNPARGCVRAPRTSKYGEVVAESQGDVELAIKEAIDVERVGFKHGWVSTHFLDKLLNEAGLARLAPFRSRRAILQGLGYIPHPALPGGRTSHVVQPDYTKPRLYVSVTSPFLKLTNPAEVCRCYSQAQEDRLLSAVSSSRGSAP